MKKKKYNKKEPTTKLMEKYLANPPQTNHLKKITMS